MKKSVFVCVAVFLTACAGKVDYSYYYEPEGDAVAVVEVIDNVNPKTLIQQDKPDPLDAFLAFGAAVESIQLPVFKSPRSGVCQVDNQYLIKPGSCTTRTFTVTQGPHEIEIAGQGYQTYNHARHTWNFEANQTYRLTIEPVKVGVIRGVLTNKATGEEIPSIQTSSEP